MAKKSRKKTVRKAKKARPARAKRTKVSRRAIGKQKTKSAKKPPRRARRAKPKAAGFVQNMVDAAREASDMRERMTARGPLGEG